MSALPYYCIASIVRFVVSAVRPRVSGSALTCLLAAFVALVPRVHATLPVGWDLTTLGKQGYLDVTLYANVFPNASGSDSTAGIQTAIDDAKTNDLVLYFPAGTYYIANTLRCYRYGSTTGANFRLVGAGGGARPVIKLISTTTKFDDAANVRPMIAFRSYGATNTVLATPPTAILDNYNPFKPLTAESFTNASQYGHAPTWLMAPSIRNLDFDCSGKDGAVGLSFFGAQHCFVMDVKVTATSAYAGFIGVPGDGGSSSNLAVEGGQLGIAIGKTGPGVTLDGASGGGSVCIAGLTLTNQTGTGIDTRNGNWTAVIVGFDITMASGKAVATTDGDRGSNSADGPVTLIDGKITMSAGGVAIDNDYTDASVHYGKNLYLRNVYFNGATTLVKSGSNALTGVSGWNYLKEYNCRDAHPVANMPAGTDSNRYWNVFETSHRITTSDDTSSTTPYVPVAPAAGTPPATLVSNHIPVVPTYDQPAINIKDAAYGATGDGVTDDLAAINLAIVAANTAGHGRVFVPKGKYCISGPLNLTATTKLFGIGNMESVITRHSSWNPGTGNPDFITTDDSATATTFLGFLGVDLGASPGRFNHISWRAGHASMIVGIRVSPYAGNSSPPVGIKTLRFSSHGGGRVYFFSSEPQQVGHLDSRGVLVDGTTEPVAFYQLNTEADRGNGAGGGPPVEMECNIEINNARNVRIYSNKREGNSSTLYVRGGSDNVGFYSFDMRPQSSSRAAVRLTGSTNILGASLVPDSVVGTQLTRKIFQDGTYNISHGQAISLYKLGELDDSKMDFSSLPAPWQTEDIGAVGLPGSATYGAGTFTTAGSGTDIYGTGDQFHFVHQGWTGDARLVARVVSQTTPPTHNFAKAGLMFRDDTATGARNIDLILAPNPSVSGTVQILQRTATNGTTAEISHADGKTMPYWLRLERHGNLFSGWHSIDGTTWFLTGSATLALNSPARAGLAVTAHDNTKLNTGVFDSVSIAAAPVWTALDIGSVGAAGSTTVDYSTDVYTVNGAGVNIFGATDSFHFYYIPWTGSDVTIVAEVTSVENTQQFAKGGLMIRQALTATSATALVDLKPGTGTSPGAEFIIRPTTGGTGVHSSGSPVASIAPPRFLKLVLSGGNTIKAYQSPDSITWTQIGATETVTLTGTYYVGLASCSVINTTNLCTATFESVYVK